MPFLKPDTLCYIDSVSNKSDQSFDGRVMAGTKLYKDFIMNLKSDSAMLHVRKQVS